MTHRFAFDIPDSMWEWMQAHLKKGEYTDYIVNLHETSIRNDPAEKEKKRIRQQFYDERIKPELKHLQKTYEYQNNDYSFLIDYFENQKIAIGLDDLMMCMNQLDEKEMAH